jgi:DNA-binding NarL/FixJ family response regulator
MTTGIANSQTTDEAQLRALINDRVKAVRDKKMPVVGRLEATRRIRSVFPNAQIIVVTQYDDQHWPTAATEARACGYLLEENLFELQQMLKSQRGSQAEHRED